jgi:hypothetical protein
MPRRSSSSVSVTSGTSESNIVFFAAGGHNHDGSNSSLIDASKYSIFDFDQGFLRTNTERSARQDRNRILFEDTVREIFRTAGVELGDNVISAQNIIAGTITANELAANTIVANNIAANTITSNELALNTITAANLSNTITLTSQLVQSGNYIAGTSGWAIYSNGYSEFGNGNFRGNITASGGTFTGKMTAGLTEIGNNIRDAANYAGIALRNDSWENAWVKRSDNSVYFRAGSATKYIQVDTTGTTTIQFPNFSVDNSGNMIASNVDISGKITASSGAIGGWTIGSTTISGGSTTLRSNGQLIVGNTTIYANGRILNSNFNVSASGALTATSATITGTINATGGSFSGDISANGTITGGEFASGTFSLSKGSSTRIRFGTSSGSGIDLDGGTYGNIYIGIAIVNQEGNRYNVPHSTVYPNASHRFVGRMNVTNNFNYSESWDRQHIVAQSTGNAGIAIRAGNDAGTVQIRVGVGNTTAYFRNHNDGGWANIEAGSVIKTGGTFKIDHPLESKKNDYWLYHSFIEGPYADLIYRGKISLINGYAEVNIDKHSGMTDGTFEKLVTNVSCLTSNETGWSNVKGLVHSNILKIYCEDASSSDTISWIVIGERCDESMINAHWTDENGRVIQEQLKNQIGISSEGGDNESSSEP